MALTCKYGSISDDMVCGLCVIEEDIKVLEAYKDHQAHPEKYICEWCREDLGSEVFVVGCSDYTYTTQHAHCQKAYKKGQQWAISKLAEWKEYNQVEGLEAELKKENNQ